MNNSIEAKKQHRQIIKADISNYFKDIYKVRDAMELENLREKSCTNYTSYLNKFSGWLVVFQGGLSFSALTPDTIREFIRFLKDTLELAPNTINGYLAAIRKMYGIVRQEELSKRVIPDLVVDTGLPKVPTVAEVGAMLKACKDDKDTLIVLLVSSTGMRCKEMQHLRFCDIRKDTKQIYIADSKGRSDGYVPLTNHVIEVLTRYCRAFNASHPDNMFTPTDYIFPSAKDRSQCESIYSLRKRLIQIQERSGLAAKGYRFHSLRHYYALNLYLQSHDLYLVKKLLRHRTLNATMKYIVLAASREVQDQYDNPGDLAYSAAEK